MFLFFNSFDLSSFTFMRKVKLIATYPFVIKIVIKRKQNACLIHKYKFLSGGGKEINRSVLEITKISKSKIGNNYFSECTHLKTMGSLHYI